MGTKNMKRYRGFSVLEVMLALIVVSIGIAVLLTFSASNHTETKNKSTANDYSIVVNNILGQFIGEVNDCNTNSPDGACPLPLDPKNAMPIEGWSAYDYLCNNTNATSSSAFSTPSSLSCKNSKISGGQYTALKNAGIDLSILKITIKAEESDVN